MKLKDEKIMISNGRTRWIYIREILNLECSAGTQDFGRGVKLIPLSNNIAKLIDDTIPRLHGRWFDKQYWIIHCEHLSETDPAKGLRVLPVIMLIIISPYLKFGPSCFIKIENGNIEVCSVEFDQLHTIMAHITPNDFVNIDNIKAKEIGETFQKLAANLFSNILEIPRDRFVRACMDKKYDDSIIDISISLESLYGGNKDNIPRYGASFIGKDAKEREINYANLATLLWARNKVIHEGVAFPNITLEDGRKLDTKQIRHMGFEHCAKALRKMIENPFWQGMTKRDVLHYFKSLARPLRNEMGIYKHTYQSVTKRRNP